MNEETFFIVIKIASLYISIGLGCAIAIYFIAEKMGERVKQLEPQVLLLALIIITIGWPYSIYRILKDYFRR